MEEGGLEVHLERRDADFFLGVFFVFFSAPFLEAPFSVFVRFWELFWVPRGGHFWNIFSKKQIVRKKGHPLFLHTIIMFWLDFQGLGLPGWLQKQEKTAPGKSCFLECF